MHISIVNTNREIRKNRNRCQDWQRALGHTLRRAVNINQVESNQWVDEIFKSSAAHVSFVFNNQRLIQQGPRTVIMLKDTPIDVVNIDQAEYNEWVGS